MAPAKKYWRVEVQWQDSSMPAETWMGWRQAVRMKQSLSTTIGFVLADDKRGVILAASVHDSEVGQVVFIPRGCIRKTRRLR